MVTTSQRLNRVGRHLDESMGVRSADAPAQLSPVASPKDAGRRRQRNAGRIEIDRVIPDPDQPRTEFDEDSLKRLAASIQAKGQLMAIRIRWSELHQKWIIVSGERRWRASKLAGLPMIDCVFHEGDMTEAETLEQQLVESRTRPPGSRHLRQDANRRRGRPRLVPNGARVADEGLAAGIQSPAR